MDGQTMVINIKKYLKKRYGYEIMNGLTKGRPFVAERKILRTEVLPGVGEEVLEILLEQMYEQGAVIKDDGHTVCFSAEFVFK
jgi:hypothetical protein